MEKNSYQFTEGQIFESFETVKKHFKNFCRHQPFVVCTHNSRQVNYICRHGIQRKSKSQGIRPNQRYNFKGCTAKVNLYKIKSGEWKVTRVSLDHNHDLVDWQNKIGKSQKKSEIDSDENLVDGQNKIGESLIKSETNSDEILDVCGNNEILDVCGNNESVNYVHWSDIEKFKMAFDAIKDIADVLSKRHTEEFLNYIQELNIVKHNIRQGLSIFNNSKNNNKQNQRENLQETNIIHPIEISFNCDM